MYILIGVLILAALLCVFILLLARSLSFKEIKDIIKNDIERLIDEDLNKYVNYLTIGLVWMLYLFGFIILFGMVVILWPLIILVLILAFIVSKMFKEVINY